QLKIKRECIELEKNIAKKRSQKVQTTEEKWDEKCNQAVQLFNQGMEYPTIAKKVGCNVSSLYRELKKRDLLQMPKQVAPCKSVKA
ncbi:helix-turn-helix domain-containing protein, partial [Bacillus thuringiensis]|nr:helix-turn-helix domain-containing protein [Bacillus thuringiensis]